MQAPRHQHLSCFVLFIHFCCDINNNNIKINIPSKHAVIRSDELKIRQILFNLLTNACKNSENSQVNLVITQGTFKDHKSIVFKVKDFGTGISKNKINTK